MILNKKLLINMLLIIVGVKHLAFASINDTKKYKSSCGINSAYLMLNISKKEITLDQLISHEINQNKHPNLSLLDIKNIVSDFGLSVSTVRMSAEDVVHLQHPFIAHVRKPNTGLGHFVLCWVDHNNELEVIDYPKKGHTIPERFAVYFTGYCLVESSDVQFISKEKEAVEEIHKTCIQKTKVESENSIQFPLKAENIFPAGAKLTWLGDNFINFGELEGKELLEETVRFELLNTGTGLLKLFDLTASCDCAEATFSSDIVKPAEKSILTVKIIKRGKGKFAEFVTFRTNDPVHPLEKVVIEGGLIPSIDISVSPRSCVFENTQQNITYNKKIALFNPVYHSSQKEFQIENIQVSRPDLLSANMFQSWNIGGKSYNKNIRKCTLEVKLQHNLLPGRYEEEIVISGNKNLKIPVEIFVEDSIKIVPQKCLINIPKGDYKRTREVCISAVDRKDAVGSVTAHSKEPWITCKVDKSKKIPSTTNIIIAVQNAEEFLHNCKIYNTEIEIEGNLNGEKWIRTIPVVVIMGSE